MLHKHRHGLIQGSLPLSHEIAAAGRRFPLDIARHPRARRYVLRLTGQGRLRLTVPRGASIVGGLRFAERQHQWIEREWCRLEREAGDWADGTDIWYRGQRIAIAVTDGAITVADLRIAKPATALVRSTVETGLRQVAAAELPERSNVLAAERELAAVKVSVRNQRSRWGSCSPLGSIALNWRLIQMPREVSDYIILHELAHRRHPNHSRRFWREVEMLCSWWRDAERWLRRYGRELL